MLEILPDDVMNYVFQYINDPIDLLNIFASCQFMKEFITNRLLDVTIHVNQTLPLYFLRHIKQLERVQILRKYNNMLDLSSIWGIKNLKQLYINSLRNVTNIPTHHVILLYSFDTLYLHIPRLKREKTVRPKNEEEFEYLTAKEYFCMRYTMKKFSKLKYKEHFLLASI